MANKRFIPQITTPEIKANWKDYQVEDAFLSMKGDKKKWSEVAYTLKYAGNNALINITLDNLFKSNPLLSSVIWGNMLPKRIEDLGTGWNRYFYKPQSVDIEINWVLQCLKKHKGILKLFVSLRDKVEKCILLGDYSQAELLLEKSLDSIGYTVWYYEMRLTIAGLQDDLSKSIGIVSNFNTIHKDLKRGFVPLVLSNIMSRSLRSVPAYEYDADLYSRYKKNRTEFQNDRYNYYLFRLNYYQNYDIDDLSVTLMMESLNSVVDRYVLMNYVFRSYIIKSDESKEIVSNYATSLYLMTSDRCWIPYILFKSYKKLPEEYYDRNFISILDKYYTGDYYNVIIECKNYLVEKPYHFDVLKLYCRALLFKNKGFRPITNNTDSVLNEVARLVHSVMTEQDNATSLDLLYQRSKNLYGLSFASGLDYYIKEEKKWMKDSWLHLSTMTCFDPLFTTAFEDNEEKLAYLDWGLKHDKGSVVIPYQKRRVEKLTTEESNVVDYIREVDNAKITFENGEYEKAIELWNSIIEKNTEYIPTVQTAVEYTFMSYINRGISYRQKAVRFYVDKYIGNKAFVSKVDTKQFMIDIKNSRYEGLKNDIDFLIFVFLNAENYPQKQFVLESYCKYENVVYPSELLAKFKRKDQKKVELFLYLLVTDDLLYHHYKLKSTLEVLDEKIKIASYLKSSFPDNYLYANMCTELMHEIVAYRGMKKLDDSKIFVNEDAIMKYELCKIDDLYDRFKKQAALVRSNRVFVLVNGADFSHNNAADLIDDIATYSNNAIEEVALQIFNVIRLAFLKSRFGLGTYLSTRIRHGVFEGELRSDLERLNLILSQSGQQYMPSDYWRVEYSLDSEMRKNLYNAQAKFSDNIDTLISSFKDSVIQIRVDEYDEKKGEFDYTIDTKELCDRLMEIESKTHDRESFCKGVIAYLWEITEARLETTRARISKELKPGIFNHLQTLEQCFDSLSGHDTLSADLKTAINNARAALTNKLTKVENWFYRQETKFEDFDIESHIRMTMEQAARYYQDIPVRMDMNTVSLPTQIRSEYSSSMFDLFFIFLTNMLRYSKNTNPRIFQISSQMMDEDIIKISLINDLQDKIQEDSLNHIFEEKMNDVAKLQQEGGSGLVKAMTIVKYDFGNTNNTFTIRATEGKCVVEILFNIKDMLVNEENIIS